MERPGNHSLAEENKLPSRVKPASEATLVKSVLGALYVALLGFASYATYTSIRDTESASDEFHQFCSENRSRIEQWFCNDVKTLKDDLSKTDDANEKKALHFILTARKELLPGEKTLGR